MIDLQNKTGVVLAAGTGARLSAQDSSKNIKPLTPVSRIVLLQRTLRALETAGCTLAVIVVGWQANIVQKEIAKNYKGPLDLYFAYNPLFKFQNGLSVLRGRPFIKGNFILTMADHILDPKIMELAGNYKPPVNGAALCVDFKIDTIFDMDDANKVLSKDGKIIQIGKQLKKYNCIDTGVFVCTMGLMDELENIYKRDGDVSLSQGIQALAHKGLMDCIDIGEAYWQDVDTLEMLNHAEALLKRNEQPDV